MPTRAIPEPFLHVGVDAIENPLTGRTLAAGSADGRALRSLLAGRPAADPAAAARLAAEGWLVPDAPDLARRSRLEYVSLETHTVCNQACYFCPVSLRPRPRHFMPTELFESIVGQLAAYRATLAGVFMLNYNEPTVDPRFVDQVRTLRRHGLAAAVNSNASGLSPATVDAIVELGGLRYLSVNLSTLDPDRYDRDRKSRALDVVLRNLDYLKDKPIAERMELVVLGRGDRRHRRDHAAIARRFGGSRFDVKRFRVMDRARAIPLGQRARAVRAPLAGCDNIGSRPLQHLHVTAHGRCVFCCEDYDERHVVGDLTRETVAEVLAGEALARLRRLAYGLDDAPADFLCRHCIFARKRTRTAALRASVRASLRAALGPLLRPAGGR